MHVLQIWRHSSSSLLPCRRHGAQESIRVRRARVGSWRRATTATAARCRVRPHLRVCTSLLLTLSHGRVGRCCLRPAGDPISEVIGAAVRTPFVNRHETVAASTLTRGQHRGIAFRHDHRGQDLAGNHRQENTQALTARRARAMGARAQMRRAPYAGRRGRRAGRALAPCARAPLSGCELPSMRQHAGNRVRDSALSSQSGPESMYIVGSRLGLRENEISWETSEI